eukprot:6784945-Pyramimonas_sp.AAC.1
MPEGFGSTGTRECCDLLKAQLEQRKWTILTSDVHGTARAAQVEDSHVRCTLSTHLSPSCLVRLPSVWGMDRDTSDAERFRRLTPPPSPNCPCIDLNVLRVYNALMALVTPTYHESE